MAVLVNATDDGLCVEFLHEKRRLTFYVGDDDIDCLAVNEQGQIEESQPSCAAACLALFTWLIGGEAAGEDVARVAIEKEE